jgi:hypothetical protein
MANATPTAAPAAIARIHGSLLFFFCTDGEVPLLSVFGLAARAVSATSCREADGPVSTGGANPTSKRREFDRSSGEDANLRKFGVANGAPSSEDEVSIRWNRPRSIRFQIPSGPASPVSGALASTAGSPSGRTSEPAMTGSLNKFTPIKMTAATRHTGLAEYTNAESSLTEFTLLNS